MPIAGEKCFFEIRAPPPNWDDRAAFLVRVAKLSAGESNKNPPVIPGTGEGKESGEHEGCLEAVSIGTGRNLRSRVPVRRPLHLYLTTVGPNLEDKWDYQACLTVSSPLPEGRVLEIKKRIRFSFFPS